MYDVRYELIVWLALVSLALNLLLGLWLRWRIRRHRSCRRTLDRVRTERNELRTRHWKQRARELGVAGDHPEATVPRVQA